MHESCESHSFGIVDLTFILLPILNSVMRLPSPCRLSIVNAEFFAFYGVRSEERTLGGRFQVDVDLYYDCTPAAINDDVNQAVNYEEALFIVREIMNAEDAYELVETIAYDIATSIIDKLLLVRDCTVRVRKLTTPVQQIMDYVEAEFSMCRDSR